MSFFLINKTLKKHKKFCFENKAKIYKPFFIVKILICFKFKDYLLKVYYIFYPSYVDLTL